MVGVKGSSGPPPKRSDQRRRRNTPAGGKPTQAESIPVPVRPEADPEWHKIAVQWYESLGHSGQAVFYQASDWAVAAVIAESISRELKPQPIVVGKGEFAEIEMHEMPPKGSSLAAWLRGMTSLLATEGDRRRAAIELTAPKPEGGDGGGSVSSIDAWRSRTDGTG